MQQWLQLLPLKNLVKLVKSAKPNSIHFWNFFIDVTSELNHLVMEAVETDGRLGRRPLQDINKEIQAHMMLSSLFIQLIEERNATIMVKIQGLI